MESVLADVAIKASRNVLTKDSYKQGAGRRSFISYRDIGVTDATGGRIYAVAGRLGKEAETVATGWHYHTCELQTAYTFAGGPATFQTGEDLAGNTTKQIGSQTFMCMSKGHPHNELGSTAGGTYLELVIGEMGTVPIEDPAAHLGEHADSWCTFAKREDAVWKPGEGARSFLSFWDFGITSKTGGKVTAHIGRRIPGSQFPANGVAYRGDALQILFVIKGWVELVREDGTKERNEAETCLCNPAGTAYTETAMSDDYEFIEWLIKL